jgi:hypothetical protein
MLYDSALRCPGRADASGTIWSVEWTVRRKASGRWAMLVLDSDKFHQLIELLIDDAVDWRFQIDVPRKRGPRGHPGYFCCWGTGIGPLATDDVRNRISKGYAPQFHATYPDGSLLKVEFIFRKWRAADATETSGIARLRARQGGEFIKQNAQWWPNFTIATWLVVAALTIGVVLCFLNLWFLLLFGLLFVLSYVLLRPHVGLAIADKLAPAGMPTITFGPINVTSAFGAVALILITILLTRWLGG